MINQLLEQSNHDQGSDQLSKSNHQNMFGSTIRVLIWNTRNANDSHWRKDFSALCADKDLVLLQSVSVSATGTQTNTVNSQCEWVASGFDQEAEGDTPAGVRTGCGVAALKQIEHIANQSEAESSLCGVLLETHYALGTSDDALMVLNMHAKADVPKSQFLDQLDQLCHCIDQHKGPVILGGSFDTWSPDKLAAFQLSAAKASLFEASLTRQGSEVELTDHLDHVFFRGMSLQSVESSPHIQSTDYSPITVKFVIERSSTSTR